MISVGNDIIALAETDQDRTGLFRFYSRILTPAELSLFGATSLSFSTFIWLLWSVKESVYKYVSRSDPRLVFSPLKIPVSGLQLRGDHYEGTICYSGQSLFSRSFLQGEAIMTVVNEDKDFSLIRWGIQAIGDSSYTTQSTQVRTFALQSLSATLPGVALRIVKLPDGPPEVWDDEQSLDIPISLAHHGRYVAWSYRLPANSSSYRKSAAN